MRNVRYRAILLGKALPLLGVPSYQWQGKSMTTILVIDRYQQVRDLLRIVLEGEGYAVVLADSGTMGMQEYRRSPTDLVLCDLFLDEQQGLTTIRKIREEFPQAKIVAISGNSTLTPTSVSAAGTIPDFAGTGAFQAYQLGRLELHNLSSTSSSPGSVSRLGNLESGGRTEVRFQTSPQHDIAKQCA